MTEHPRPFRRQLLLNTASSGLANLWAMAVALVALPIYLEGLGATAFGMWALLQTFSATNGWLSLADLGVVVATVREVPSRAADEDAHAVRRVVSASLVLCTSIGVVAAAVLATVGVWVLPALFNAPSDIVSQFRVALLALAVQVVFDLAINSIEGSLEGLQRVDLSRLIDVGRRTLVIGSSAVVALLTGNLAATAIAAAAATLLSAVLAVAVLARRLPRFLVRSTRSDRRGLLRYGRSVALLRPMGVITRTMDRVIVGVVLGPTAVSLVEIANQLQASADAVLSASSYAVVPASSWLAARRDRSALAEMAERGTKYSMLVTLPIVILVALLAAPLIEVWLGPEYADAAGLATVAVLAVALKTPLAVGSQMLLGMGHASENLRAAAIALVVNLAASVVLVRAVGVVGSFQGTLLGGAVMLPLLGGAVLRLVDVDLRTAWAGVVRPVVLPCVAQLLVLGSVVAAPFGEWTTLLLGATASTAAFVAVAASVAVSGDERRELVGLVRGGRPGRRGMPPPSP